MFEAALAYVPLPVENRSSYGQRRSEEQASGGMLE